MSDKQLTDEEKKLLASSQHDQLTAELHAEAVAQGITPAALAQTPPWRERLKPQEKTAEAAESAEPAKVVRREKRRSP
jgi:hypothetical protein